MRTVIAVLLVLPTNLLLVTTFQERKTFAKIGFAVRVLSSFVSVNYLLAGLVVLDEVCHGVANDLPMTKITALNAINAKQFVVFVTVSQWPLMNLRQASL